MSYTLVLTTCYNNDIITYEKCCENGVHEILKQYLEYDIILPWDGELNVLQDILGIGNGYLELSHGLELYIKKPLPDIGMYVKLVEIINDAYMEDFCHIKITDIFK